MLLLNEIQHEILAAFCWLLRPSRSRVSELLATERGCVEDQPQQPDCRIQSSLPTPLCHGKLLRLASEAQPRSDTNNSESTGCRCEGSL